MKFLLKIFFVIYFSVFFTAIMLVILLPVFNASEISYSLGFVNIELSKKFPTAWINLKNIYCLTCFLSFLIIINSVFSISQIFLSGIIHSNSQDLPMIQSDDNKLSVHIGQNSKKELVSIPINGLYQNVLVTGSIGSGKTSSLLYPLTSQLLGMSFSSKYHSAFLILDVKGNYHNFVQDVCRSNFHLGDLFIISLTIFRLSYKYN